MKQIRIAITGGIGSGKSTVANFLQKKYHVFSCDEIYKELATSPAFLSKIEENFSGCVKEGRLDKKRLSDLVFSNPTALQTLNKISHTEIMAELFSSFEQTNASVVFSEVPLLFEGGFETLFDKIIVVYRKEEMRIQAVVKRSGLSVQEVKQRIKNQFRYSDDKNDYPCSEKISVIINEGSLNELFKTTDEIVQDIVKQ